MNASLCTHYSKDIAQKFIERFTLSPNRYLPKHCNDCSLPPVPGTWICLYPSCRYIGCGKYDGNHAHQHAKLNGHHIAINSKNKIVMCYSCNRELYSSDNDMDGITPLQLAIASEYHRQSSLSPSMTPTRHCLPLSLRTPVQTPTSPLRYVNDLMTSPIPITVDDDPFLLDGLDDSYNYTNSTPSKSSSITRCGLRNVGNTCYFNSSLQSLMNCTYLTRYFQLFYIKNDSSTLQKKLALNYYDILNKKDNSRVIIPNLILKDILALHPHFRGYDQHDAHEALLSLIDHLHEATVSPSLSIKGLPLSPISDLFYHHVTSEVRCVQCGARSSRTEPHAGFSVSISGPTTPNKCYHGITWIFMWIWACFGGCWAWIADGIMFVLFGSDDADEGSDFSTIPLESCLREFDQSSPIDYACDSCKAVSVCERRQRLSVDDSPVYVIIHLKRFRYTAAWGMTKINTHVKAPLHGLKVTADSPEYSLVALVVHHGNVHSGHYTTYVADYNPNSNSNDDSNDVDEGIWWCCDDAKVTRATTAHVLSSQAYILVYQRQFNNILMEREAIFQQIWSARLSILSCDEEKYFVPIDWLHRWLVLETCGRIPTLDYICRRHHKLFMTYNNNPIQSSIICVSSIHWRILVRDSTRGSSNSALTSPRPIKSDSMCSTCVVSSTVNNQNDSSFKKSKSTESNSGRHNLRSKK